MGRIKVSVVAVLATLALANCGSASQQKSSDATGVPDYNQWQSDVRKVTDPAIPWLQSRAGQGGGKLAIVLDIDNTAIETHFHPGQPNRPVLKVAQWAKSNNVSVLFVTLRDEKNRDATTRQLTSAGYAVDGLCMRTTGELTKPRCRQGFVAAGYTLTANIGNRNTDFNGGDEYERAFKLPDYNGELE